MNFGVFGSPERELLFEREAMQRFAEIHTLATWYAHATIDDVMSMLEDGKARLKAFAWSRRRAARPACERCRR
jgi:hypothetical protein